MTVWQSQQKAPTPAPKAMANRFTQPAVKGDAVYVVGSLDGKSVAAVGVDNTMANAQRAVTTRGLKVGDTLERAVQLYGPPAGGDLRRSVYYVDVPKGQPSLRLAIDLEQTWAGEDVVQRIEWVAVTPPPTAPICQE